jgi:hypothetical protein
LKQEIYALEEEAKETALDQELQSKILSQVVQGAPLLPSFHGMTKNIVMILSNLDTGVPF